MIEKKDNPFREVFLAQLRAVSAVGDSVMELRRVFRDHFSDRLPELGGCLLVITSLAAEDFLVHFQHVWCDHNSHDAWELIVPLLPLKESLLVIGRCRHAANLRAFDTGHVKYLLRDGNGDVLERDVHSR